MAGDIDRLHGVACWRHLTPSHAHGCDAQQGRADHEDGFVHGFLVHVFASARRRAAFCGRGARLSIQVRWQYPYGDPHKLRANPYRNPIVAEQGIRIGTLARQLGTTPKTLRFYEQIGLLGPAQRSQSAYRLYDSEAVATARLVLGLRHLDLSIAELQDMLRDDGKTTRRRRLMALMDERLRRMELELSVIQGRCDDLSARHAALLATPRERPPHCVCEALLQPCLCLKKALKTA